MAEYKERYRGLRAAVGDKDKQLDLAKRTIERLSGQCNAMEASPFLHSNSACNQYPSLSRNVNGQAHQ